MNSDYKIGWNLYCMGKDLDCCVNEEQRRGWAAAFCEGEQSGTGTATDPKGGWGS